jgi:hypothetical protein
MERKARQPLERDAGETTGTIAAIVAFLVMGPRKHGGGTSLTD